MVYCEQGFGVFRAQGSGVSGARVEAASLGSGHAELQQLLLRVYKV